MAAERAAVVMLWVGSVGLGCGGAPEVQASRWVEAGRPFTASIETRAPVRWRVEGARSWAWLDAGEGVRAIRILPEPGRRSALRVTAELGETARSVTVTACRQMVVLKADDLRPLDGRLSPAWQRFVDWIRAEGLAADLGVIGRSLEAPGVAYLRSLRGLVADPAFELWNHGYDHLRHPNADGEAVPEFRGRSEAQQYARLRRTEDLMFTWLDYVPETFGAPENAWDERTAAALERETRLDLWLFGRTPPPAGLRVLRRTVDAEWPAKHSNEEAFMAAWDPTQPLVVLQLHPDDWDDAAFAAFTRIAAALKAASACFVHASDWARCAEAGACTAQP